MPNTMETEVTDTERIIDEHTQGISQAIEKERNKLREFREIAQQESRQTIARAYQESNAITTRAQQEAEQIVAEAKEQANKQAERVIADTQQKAGQITRQMEQNAYFKTYTSQTWCGQGFPEVKLYHHRLVNN